MAAKVEALAIRDLVTALRRMRKGASKSCGVGPFAITRAAMNRA